jgi:hypothetical protein
VYSKERSGSAISSAFLSSTAFAVLIAGLCAVSLSGLINSCYVSSGVSIDFKRIAWWTDVNVEFEGVVPVEPTTVVVESVVPNKTIAPEKRRVIHARKLRTAVVHKTHKSQPVPTVIDTSLASPAEMLQMQSIHQALRSSLFVAVENAPRTKEEALVKVEEKAEGQSEVVVNSPAPQVELNTQAVTEVVVSTVEEVEKNGEPVLLAAASEVNTQKPVTPLVFNQVIHSKTDKINSKTMSDTGAAVPALMAMDTHKAHTAKSQVLGLQNEVAAMRPVLAPTPMVAPKTLSTHAGSLLLDSVSTHSSAARTISEPIKHKMSTQPVVTTHDPVRRPAPTGENVDIPNAPPEGGAENKRGVYGLQASNYHPTTEDTEVCGASEPRMPTAVEGFEWSRPVLTADVSTFSHEGYFGCQQGRWLVARADGYWPTLGWLSSNASESSAARVPLVSRNTALFLAKLAGATRLSGDMGMLIGHIPAGWSLQFSGRSEAVVFLDKENNLVSDATEKDRYFALINTAPGAHLLYMVGPDGKEEAAIAVPVLEGTATYLELKVPERVDLSGYVFDGKSRLLKGVAEKEIRVIGQSSKVALTDSRGRFKITGVLISGDYPIYLETESASKYTHRYRVERANMDRAVLFQFHESQIEGWIRQLERGIGADGGMLVVGLPNIFNKSDESALYPGLRPTLSNPTFSPETYSLTADDRLIENTSLEKESPRFISVEIPDGPGLAELKSKEQKTLWSKLIFSSPKVINVIGPN